MKTIKYLTPLLNVFSRNVQSIKKKGKKNIFQPQGILYKGLKTTLKNPPIISNKVKTKSSMATELYQPFTLFICIYLNTVLKTFE